MCANFFKTECETWTDGEQPEGAISPLALCFFHISQVAVILVYGNSQGFSTPRTAVPRTDTTCAVASKLSTGTAPETTSVSSKEHVVSTKHISLELCSHYYANELIN